MRSGPGLTAALLIAMLGSAAGARAQVALDSREELARSRPEAWALRWHAAALAPSSFGPVEPGPARRIELALDLAGLPTLSTEQRTIGFNGTKTEDLNRAPVAARDIEKNTRSGLHFSQTKRLGAKEAGFPVLS